jgi:signal peptidase
MTDDNSDTDTDADADANSRLQKVPWRRIANVVGLLLIIAIVIPFVVFSVPQVVGADHSYVVLSGSMEPTMSPGDAVIVNSVGASTIEKGDVITYGEGGEGDLTTHRVIEVVEQDGNTAFRTKGDANEDPDRSLVTPDEIQGKVMSVGGYLFVIPYIGYVLNFANTSLGMILIFAVPLTLLVFNEVWNLIVASRAETDTDDESGSESAAAESDTADAAESDADDTESDVDTVESDAEAVGSDVDDTESDADTTDSDADAVEEETVKTAADAEDGAEDEAEAETESSSGGITFTAAELQLGLIVLAVFLSYSVWVAYQTLEVWAFGVGGGVASAFLLLTGLYFFGGGSGDATDDGGSDADSGTDSADGHKPVASVGAESELSTHVESPAIDPEFELDILEDMVGQTGDGGNTAAAADGTDQHLSDGGTSPVTADDEQEAPSSTDPDRTASVTGGPEGGENGD